MDKTFRNSVSVCVHTAESDTVWVCFLSPLLVVGITGVGLKGGDLHDKEDCVCVSF